jgi:hypothetical protein
MRLLALMAFLVLACAIPRAGQSPSAWIWVRSHNASEVEIYLTRRFYGPA